jgi:hypothetical protein
MLLLPRPVFPVDLLAHHLHDASQVIFLCVCHSKLAFSNSYS